MYLLQYYPKEAEKQTFLEKMWSKQIGFYNSVLKNDVLEHVISMNPENSTLITWPNHEKTNNSIMFIRGI